MLPWSVTMFHLLVSYKCVEWVGGLRDLGCLKDNKKFISQTSHDITMRDKEVGTPGFKWPLVFLCTMKTDEHLYTLTRTEFAKNIGKSKEAVKKDMMRGKYKTPHIFKNGQYYLRHERSRQSYLSD